MRIGRLRHRVTMLAPYLTARDDTGATTPSWNASQTVWAEVRTVSGYEQDRPDLNTVTSGYTHTVTVRRGGLSIDTRWRVQWGGRILQVVAVREPDNRGRVIVLDCAEVVP